MTTMTTVQLVASQIAASGDVLARAFADDPFFTYILSDPSERERRLPALMSACTRYGHLFGEVYTTDGAVEASAIWLPPSDSVRPAEHTERAGLGAVIEAFSAEARARFAIAVAHMDRIRAALTDPHWSLLLLGVEPRRQGQGIGSRLLQPMLRRMDSEQIPCHLHTEKAGNVPFYEKHGFRVIREENFPEGGPRSWFMVRTPRA